jgi:hypothetical protein
MGEFFHLQSIIKPNFLSTKGIPFLGSASGFDAFTINIVSVDLFSAIFVKNNRALSKLFS